MKTTLPFLFILIVCTELSATNVIPNASFENWSSSSYNAPTNYQYTSNQNVSYYNDLLNVVKTTEAYSGQYAVKLSTITTSWGPSIAYFLNTDPNEGNVATWKNGFLYNQKPTGIRGYYKYNQTTADSALIMLVFRKGGATIGNYTIKLGGVKNSYTLFDVPLVPALTQTPDSIIFGAVSSDFSVHENGVVGSVLYLDSVSLKGVSSQPALFNGSFEDWTSYQLPLTIDDWNSQDKRQEGISRTTDAKDGNYAIELTSLLEDDDDDNVLENSIAYLTNGYWDDNCGCNKGGIPFTNAKDTLSFWYKYSASSYQSVADKAQVNLQFTKDGQYIYGASKQLDATSEYKYVEVPFDYMESPDHVIIDFNSSLWDNKNAAYAGSKLIIDKLQFKSEIVYTGLFNPDKKFSADIYPSVSSGIFKINNPNQLPLQVEVYSYSGAKVFVTTVVNNEINLTGLAGGMYLAKIKSIDGSVVRKITKQ